MITEERVSFTTLFKAVVGGRRIAAAVIIAGSALSLAAALLMPPVYTAEAVILPSGRNLSAPSLGGALGLINIDWKLQGSPNSSFLFPAILESSVILDRLLDSPAEVGHSTEKIAKIIGAGDRDDSRKKLAGMIDIITDERTGIVRIRATTRIPDLSSTLANRMVSLLEEFNSGRRRLKASLDYDFLRDELEKTKKELLEAENDLAAFEKDNRDCFKSTSPRVRTEHDRLTRNMQLRLEIYIGLIKQAELADIERLKETPVVRVLDEASVPSIKSGPPRKLITLAGAGGSLLAGILIPLLMQIRLRSLIAGILSDRRPEDGSI